MKTYRIKNKEGLYSNGKKFTKNGKIFASEGGLTNHIIQSDDKFKYVGQGITLVIFEDMVEKEQPIEMFLYEKLVRYFSGKKFPIDNMSQLADLAMDQQKNGFDISDEWE
jgi:hypothetical protein